ncbi:MAG: caspase family protein [Synechococcales bacterium]|nr:caspase family protein [Synechococcales bacterium]
MKRRDFLIRSTLLGASLALSDGLLDRAAFALAAPTARKLALLIGINQYPDQPLKGCLTDLELQRELLIYRGGFQPQDIVVLSDRAATADEIAIAYQTHVIEQAKPGDIVLLHFSGYGRCNLLSQAEWLTLANNRLEEGRITEAQLLTWLKATPTEQMTTVMDTSFYYPAQRPGILRYRSRPAQGNQPTTAEPLPGLVLTGCDRNQVAVELDGNDWSAGQFTYALTQRLWQMMPPLSQTILLQQVSQDLSRSLDSLQQPQVLGQAANGTGAGRSGGASLGAYRGLAGVGCAGVIQQSLPETGIATLWLGGLAPMIVEQVQSGSIFQTVTQPAQFLQVLDRNGLMAKVRFSGNDVQANGLHTNGLHTNGLHTNSLNTNAAPSVPERQSALPPVSVPELFSPGTLIREAIRLLPRNPNLLIALDPQLTKIEKVDAISALSNLAQVSALATGEGNADYLLAKAVDRSQQQIALLPQSGSSSTPMTQLIPPANYALFSTAKLPLTSTMGQPGEAVKVAVKRLVPMMKILLAQKMLNLMENAIATRLSLEATLESVAPQPQLLLRQVSGDGMKQGNKGNFPSPDQEVPKIAVGSRLRFFLTNQSVATLYWLLMTWDGRQNSYLILPMEACAEINSGMGQPLMSSPANPEWIVRAPTGLAESLLLCSTQPFHQTQAIVTADADNFLHTIVQPLEVVQAILQDLQAASPVTIELATSETVALDVRTWAGFRFQYQVV